MPIVSYNSHDYLNIQPVPVIASFDSEGHIAPLYIRLDGLCCKVEQFHVRARLRNSVEFHCTLSDGERTHPLTLNYYRDEDLWAITGRNTVSS